MKTALITGAAQGIGFEFAKILAQKGYELYLVDINKKSLSLATKSLNIKTHKIVQDLTKHDSAKKIFKKAPKIDLLINNAGIGKLGYFWETDEAITEKIMQLNAVTPTSLARLYLPGMIKRRKGGIINVASLAAFEPGPLMSVYHATKAYMLSLSEALAVELKGTNVAVTCLCPGPTKTGFQKKAGLGTENLMSAHKVALAGYKAWKKGKTVVIPGFRNKLGFILTKILPRKISTQIVANSRISHYR